MIRQLLLLIAIFCIGHAFTAPAVVRRSPLSAFVDKNKNRGGPIYSNKRDASRSGTKRERLDKLAELEESRVETDKGFVLKAAGGFVGLIIVLLIVALTSGVLDGALNTGY